MRIWLDDKRPKPHDYDVHVVTADEAIALLKECNVTVISLDHDLGEKSITGDGKDVAEWIEEQAYLGNIPRIEWHIHSQNPVGARAMQCALEKADQYWSEHERVRTVDGEQK